MLMVVEIN